MASGLLVPGSARLMAFQNGKPGSKPYQAPNVAQLGLAFWSLA